MIGPGIAQASYGGTMMIFPPIHIADIWHDRAFDAADTMEERLLMAACTYSITKTLTAICVLRGNRTEAEATFV